MEMLYTAAGVKRYSLLWGDYVYRNKLDRNGIIKVLNKIIDGKASLSVTSDGFYYLYEVATSG